MKKILPQLTIFCFAIILGFSNIELHAETQYATCNQSGCWGGMLPERIPPPQPLPAGKYTLPFNGSYPVTSYYDLDPTSKSVGYQGGKAYNGHTGTDYALFQFQIKALTSSSVSSPRRRTTKYCLLVDSLTPRYHPRFEMESPLIFF